MKKITVLGGGTGTFVVLSGLKEYDLDLGVIVTMMDSGGSTGRLRDQLGVLPPGDLRQCLIALSEAPILWRQLFLYRFDRGDFKGHNFGNIFLSALEKVSHSYEEVIETASYVLQTKGKVIPVTFDKTNMCVEYENGVIIKGEGNIDKNYKEKTRVKKAFLEPEVDANPQAIKRLEESDYIITGPGDLYASIIPILLVKGIREAIKKSHAKIIYNLNLMTKSGQTTNYKASDHIQDIKKYFGRSPDIILVNNSPIPPAIIDWYKKQQESTVVNNLSSINYQGHVVEDNLTDNNTFFKPEDDTFVDPRVRSILRHDPMKLAKIIHQVINKY